METPEEFWIGDIRVRHAPELEKDMRELLGRTDIGQMIREALDEHAEFVRMEKVHTTDPQVIACPNCGSEQTWKHGFQSGQQMYLCSKCRKRFNTKNAPWHMSNSRARVASSISMYYRGLSLSDISEQLKEIYGETVNPSTVYRWIMRYSQQAVDTIGRIPIKTVSDTWIIDETAIKINGKQYWFWDAIDEDTRFLLGSHLSSGRTTNDAETFIRNSFSRAGRPPTLILSDGLPAYRDGIERVFGADSAHMRASPFTEPNHTNLIERFHGTIKERTKVLRGFKTYDTANLIMQGFLVHYNYFRPHMSLRNQTPAEVAGIQINIKNWLDVVRADGALYEDEI